LSTIYTTIITTNANSIYATDEAAELSTYILPIDTADFNTHKATHNTTFSSTINTADVEAKLSTYSSANIPTNISTKR